MDAQLVLRMPTWANHKHGDKITTPYTLNFHVPRHLETVIAMTRSKIHPSQPLMVTLPYSFRVKGS